MKPGDRLVITYNPHVASATNVVGEIVSLHPGEGFQGCGLAQVEFTDPPTGETHVFPFATYNLASGDRGALIRWAERHETEAARLRALAEEVSS